MNNVLLSYQIFSESKSNTGFNKLASILKNDNKFKSIYCHGLITFYTSNNNVEINIFDKNIIEIFARIGSEETQEFLKLTNSLINKVCMQDGPSRYSMELYIQEEKPFVLENLIDKNNIGENLKEIDFILDTAIKVKIINGDARYTAHMQLKDNFGSVEKIYPHFIQRNNPLKNSFHISNLILEHAVRTTSSS